MEDRSDLDLAGYSDAYYDAHVASEPEQKGLALVSNSQQSLDTYIYMCMYVHMCVHMRRKGTGRDAREDRVVDN